MDGYELRYVVTTPRSDSWLINNRSVGLSSVHLCSISLFLALHISSAIDDGHLKSKFWYRSSKGTFLLGNNSVYRCCYYEER